MASMGGQGFIFQHENLDAHQKKSVLDGNNKNPKVVISKESKDIVGATSRPLANKKQQNAKEEVFNRGWLCDGQCCARSEAHQKQLFLDELFPFGEDDVEFELDMGTSEYPDVYICGAVTQEGRSAVSKGRKRKKTNESASTSRVVQRKVVNTRSQAYKTR